MSNTNKQHAEGNMSLVGHLKEIRNRIALVAVALIVAFIVCFTFIKPFATKLLQMGQNFGFQYVYLSPSELITAYFKLSLILAVVIVSPLILAQIWGFLAPALTKREKKAIGPAFAGGLVFFFIGGAFSYVIAIPFMIQFLINYGQSDMIASAISVASYLDFMIGMVLTFGLVFEMPMLAFVLSNLGILTPDVLKSLRSYAIVLIFIVAAVITPPDIVSQFMIAVPMIGLYELSILISAVIARKRAKREAMEEAGEYDDEDEDEEEYDDDDDDE